MTDLYRRILMWHKLVAVVTGGLALCSAKHRLNRTEALDWVISLRNVADEIDSIVRGGSFLLDDKGQRVVGFSHGKVLDPNMVLGSHGRDNVEAPDSPTDPPDPASGGSRKEVSHAKPGVMPDTDGPPVNKPAGGPRVVRKRQ